jgi:hypothetical protein
VKYVVTDQVLLMRAPEGNPESYLTWVLPKLATATTTTCGGLLPHDYAVLKAH